MIPTDKRLFLICNYFKNLFELLISIFKSRYFVQMINNTNSLKKTLDESYDYI